MRQAFHCVAICILSLSCVLCFSVEDKSVPPKGAALSEALRAELAQGVAALGKELDSLKVDLNGQPKLLELLPDVQIFHNAVRFALEDDIFYENAKTKNNDDADTARNLLKMGMERAKQLRTGQSPWTSQTGRVVRGYVSEMDRTAIPYGLLVPTAYKAGDAPHRLDFWFHGRDEKLSELRFIAGCMKSNGEFSPENTFVLHPYGRLCNAYKFAGEVDAFEAYRHACAHYPIDAAKVSVRGFSMGGAATWHMGAHYAGRWAAVNPGAGFTDVRTYQKIDLKNTKIPWYEQKLWHLYDAVDYAINLTNTTLVAYSGEIDPQKQAADLIEKTLATEGVKMTHIIGPQTGHKYEPKAKAEVVKLVDAAANKGRDPQPREIHFTTWTLKYNQMAWVTINALDKHWERARIDAKIVEGDKSGILVTTSNVAAFTLTLERQLTVVIDDVPAGLSKPNTVYVKTDGKWQIGTLEENQLRKRHNLQGPIDDAFMEAFLMVRPTGTALNEKIGRWTKSEMDGALQQWRRQMRGEARVKNDADVSDADIAECNLILWGDPSSNKILAKIADKLPLKWNAQSGEFGAKSFPADSCAPVLIYPNPLNPKKYVVLNSGFTFARFGAASNSQQTPKLPDWAVIDMDVRAEERLTAGVKSAGFFGERWELEK